MSETSLIASGVPQGSILGPVLFLLYINDFPNISSDFNAYLFPDDTNLFIEDKNLITLETRVNNILAKLKEWLAANKLSLNISKTSYILFSLKKVTNSSIVLKIDSFEIAQVNLVKFLGVIIDSKLTWKSHIDYICTKIAKAIAILNKVKKIFHLPTLISLYYTFVYPYIFYCNIIWGIAAKCHLNKLLLLQKRIVRIITLSDFKVHTKVLFESLEILTVEKVYIYSVLLFMYYYKNDKLPLIFEEYFIKNLYVHNIATRNAKNYHLPKCRTNLAKNYIKFKGAYLYNC